MTLPAYSMNLSSFPEMYEQLLVQPLFRPWVDDLFARVSLQHGDRVLDVACGTGIVARCAKERLGADAHVVGVDVSAPMLAVASDRAPTVVWREGSANALPVGAAERFDVVLCQQGLQFFPDKPAALREIRRVAAPNARIAISCWCSADQMPMFRDLQQVAERHLGAIDDERFGFGDGAALEQLLCVAGFSDVTVDRVTRTIRFADAAMWVRMNAMALVGMSKVAAKLADEGRTQVREVIERESMAILAPYRDRDGIAFEACTNVATAHV